VLGLSLLIGCSSSSNAPKGDAGERRPSTAPGDERALASPDGDRGHDRRLRRHRPRRRRPRPRGTWVRWKLGAGDQAHDRAQPDGGRVGLTALTETPSSACAEPAACEGYQAGTPVITLRDPGRRRLQRRQRTLQVFRTPPPRRCLDRHRHRLDQAGGWRVDRAQWNPPLGLPPQG